MVVSEALAHSCAALLPSPSPGRPTTRASAASPTDTTHTAAVAAGASAAAISTRPADAATACVEGSVGGAATRGCESEGAAGVAAVAWELDGVQEEGYPSMGHV